MIRRQRLRSTVLALALLMCVLPAGIAAAEGTEESTDGLRLRSNIMVDEDVIRLGDLFMESLSVGDTPIAQAPAPGLVLETQEIGKGADQKVSGTARLGYDLPEDSPPSQ